MEPEIKVMNGGFVLQICNSPVSAVKDYSK